MLGQVKGERVLTRDGDYFVWSKVLLGELLRWSGGTEVLRFDIDSVAYLQWGCVKTRIKFWWSPVKSGSVSNVERGTKSGRVRRELNLCVGSPVTEAYSKSDDGAESR